MKNIILLCIAFMIAFSGCAVNEQAATYAEAPKAVEKDGYAIFYVYREYAEPTAWANNIKINDQKVVSLKQQGFTWFYVPEGSLKFETSWPGMAGMPKKEFDFDSTAGSVYFFEVVGRSRVAGTSMQGNQLITNFSTMTGINNQDATDAIARLKECCRYVAPLISEVQ